ncbi:decarboxylating 6-phosphogluconate dehydrogenase [Novosphingobium sp. MW5]|nr:decarboxylating 6-phosphogluconate dehydrogenase [Novosphingobium sp. MW5]
MQIGIVGAGRMGGNMALRLLRGGHDVVIHDPSVEAMQPVVAEGGLAVDSLAAMIGALAAPRTVWVMVPAGAITEQVVEELSNLLSPGDTLIDGGNSNFKNTIERAEMLAAKGLVMLDVGTSGGVHGLTRGYCLMVGGETAAVERNAPIFATLAPGMGEIERTPARVRGLGSSDTAEHGWLHCGPSGSGHYVKMVHNGIEYGMMQAMAEGFALMATAGSDQLPANRRFDIDCGAVAELWRRGSVVTSWLLDLTADSLAETPDLAPYSAQVQDSGEGRWTVDSAVEQSVAAPVLTAALYERFRSRTSDGFGDKLLSAMRYKFGGHTAPKA